MNNEPIAPWWDGERRRQKIFDQFHGRAAQSRAHRARTAQGRCATYADRLAAAYGVCPSPIDPATPGTFKPVPSNVPDPLLFASDVKPIEENKMPVEFKPFIIKVAGVTFPDPKTGVNRQDYLAVLTTADSVRIQPEPDNAYDKNALAVLVSHNGSLWHCGYVPRDLAAKIAPHLQGGSMQATIREITGGFETYAGNVASHGLIIEVQLPIDAPNPISNMARLVKLELGDNATDDLLADITYRNDYEPWDYWGDEYEQWNDDDDDEDDLPEDEKPYTWGDL